MKLFLTFVAIIGIGSASADLGGIIASKIEKFKQQMPCGIPSAGVPVLAPLTIGDKGVSYKNGFIGTTSELKNAQIHGLDNFETKFVKVNLLTRRIQAEFVWDQINVTSGFDTESLFKRAGFSVDIVGKGELNIALNTLVATVDTKYAISIKNKQPSVKSFKLVISLNDCAAKINGIFGKGFVNAKLTQMVCIAITEGVNGNQKEITDAIEALLVPIINEQLSTSRMLDVFTEDSLLDEAECNNAEN